MTELLHKLTQAGYIVSFVSDFEGMIRIDLTKEYEENTGDFYEHAHLSFPGGSMEQLEIAINKCLNRAVKEYCENK